MTEAQSTSKRAMIIVAGDDVDHDLLSAAPYFTKLAGEAGFVTRQAAGMQRFVEPFKTTSSQDIFVLYKAGGEFSPAQQLELGKWVHEGRGLLAIHCSNVMGDVGPDAPGSFRTFFELLGNRYLSHGPGHHQGRHTIEIVAEHPITAGVTDFELFDEYYEFELADDDIQVLAQRHRADGEIIPVLYTREVGEGRVVYLALGHDFRSWGEPSFQRLVRQAMAWIAHES
ncbi:MAG: glycosyl hydrolase [Microbacteriaceae bacterium]|jgi:type 1 glutamine amidotransferase|nr:glycosyl hydrolase [Microbacteriaceae bacterium]